MRGFIAKNEGIKVFLIWLNFKITQKFKSFKLLSCF